MRNPKENPKNLSKMKKKALTRKKKYIFRLLEKILQQVN